MLILQLDKFYLMVEAGSRLAKPDNTMCTEQIFTLMKWCWNESPESRPTFSNIVDQLNDVKMEMQCM